jgi:hypothetical protein
MVLVFLVEPFSKGVCKVFDTGFARERFIFAGDIGFRVAPAWPRRVEVEGEKVANVVSRS